MGSPDQRVRGRDTSRVRMRVRAGHMARQGVRARVRVRAGARVGLGLGLRLGLGLGVGVGLSLGLGLGVGLGLGLGIGLGLGSEVCHLAGQWREVKEAVHHLDAELQRASGEASVCSSEELVGRGHEERRYFLAQPLVPLGAGVHALA